MEGTASIDQIREIMGPNFIGPSELTGIAAELGVVSPFQLTGSIPEIPFELSYLEKVAGDFLLILGIPVTDKNELLTLIRMRTFFGMDPIFKEPCFYNQDWYLNEDFAKIESIEFKWYLVQKEVNETSRGRNPHEFLKQSGETTKLPSAILATYSFFAWYMHTKGEILWNHDYIWCSDRDCHGDQIYVGRYTYSFGLNKNGFSIHRHLSIKRCYGVVSVL